MHKILFLLLILPFVSYSQNTSSWHFQDPDSNNLLGISATKALHYLKDRTPDTVTVAIIDNGCDLNHEDLKNVFWTNQKELSENNIDDDNNGYIDDINGWNFLGNKDGRNLKRETTDLTRLYAIMHNKYKDRKKENIDPEQFELYSNIFADYHTKKISKKKDIISHKNILKKIDRSDKILSKYFKNKNYTEYDVLEINKKKKKLVEAKEYMLRIYKANYTRSLVEQKIVNLEKDLNTRLNPEFSNRADIVGDDPHDISDTDYGNNMLNVKGPWHGTGVAGIVAALNNDIGITGIAQHIKLMIIRIVPNGDERDKDVLLAIRYAINNGAEIINCSFGKKYSSHPEFAEMAIKEAEDANVLVIFGSGNASTNNDVTPFYPTGNIKEGRRGNTCIRVGATSQKDNENLVAYFSNYGKESVDIFAPGVDIEITNPGNLYGKASGTSTAAPVLTGMAAVIKSYFPELRAAEIKEIILKSVYKPKTKFVKIPGTKDKTEFNKLSLSGGIANLYNAIILIEKEYIR